MLKRIVSLALSAVFSVVLLSQAYAVEQLVPMAAGNKWVYAISESGVTSLGSGDQANSTTTNGKGICTETVEIAKGQGPGGLDAFLDKLVINMDAAASTQANEASSESIINATANGLELSATKMSGLDGITSDKWEKYVPPLLLYKAAAKPGDVWQVGALREGNLQMPQQAKVVGTETVEIPSGKFENCLKISMTCGKISGGFTIRGLDITVKDGKVVDTVWIAKGVGVVKEDEVIQMSFDLPFGGDGQSVPVTATKRKTKILQPGYKVN